MMVTMKSTSSIGMTRTETATTTRNDDDKDDNDDVNVDGDASMPLSKIAVVAEFSKRFVAPRKENRNSLES